MMPEGVSSCRTERKEKEKPPRSAEVVGEERGNEAEIGEEEEAQNATNCQSLSQCG